MSTLKGFYFHAATKDEDILKSVKKALTKAQTFGISAYDISLRCGIPEITISQLRTLRKIDRLTATQIMRGIQNCAIEIPKIKKFLDLMENAIKISNKTKSKILLEIGLYECFIAHVTILRTELQDHHFDKLNSFIQKHSVIQDNNNQEQKQQHNKKPSLFDDYYNDYMQEKKEKRLFRDLWEEIQFGSIESVKNKIRRLAAEEKQNEEKTQNKKLSVINGGAA